MSGEEHPVPERSREELFQKVEAVVRISSWCLTLISGTFVTVAVVGISDHFLLQKHSDQIAELKEVTKSTGSDHEAVVYMRPKVEGLWWASRLSKTEENP